VFRETLDEVAETLRPELGADLRELLYPHNEKAAASYLAEPFLAHPALFAVSLAMGRLWLSLGIRPAALIGHSSGECVAATLAGVFTTEAGAALAAARGRLIQGLRPGTMLAVPLPEGELISLLHPELSLAAVNSPRLCIVSGEIERISAFDKAMSSRGVLCRRVATIRSISREDCLSHFLPKVAGLRAMRNALRGVDVDFCLPTSSLSSVLGGLHYAPYAAANLFMDTFAVAQRPVLHVSI
jgi:phthiocerol/phenolphthiocerol synthesis type-I polyketide synthase E